MKEKPTKANEKRTESVNVRMSPADLTLIEKAAVKQWPGAVMSQAAIVLSLARMMAQSIADDGQKKAI